MKKNITYGEKYNPAMKIETQKEADAYFEKCVKHTMLFNHSRKKAIEIERKNFGYYAGYYDDETQKRVQMLFRCNHPIFGSAEKQITPQEAIEAGIQFAKSNPGG